MNAEQDLVAPRFRRILAFVVDFLITLLLTQGLFAIVMYFVPADTGRSMMPSLITGLLIGFSYLGFSTPIFGNHFGKWLFGLKIIGYGGRKVSKIRWFIRLVLVSLWPINIFMLVFARSRRHLGDLAAKTYVVMSNPGKNIWLGLVCVLLIGASTTPIAGFLMKVGILNAPSYLAAKAFLEGTDQIDQSLGIPKGFLIRNDEAMFDFEVDGVFYRVVLDRAESGWDIREAAQIDTPTNSANITFSNQ